jgi:hypothetical protein
MQMPSCICGGPHGVNPSLRLRWHQKPRCCTETDDAYKILYPRFTLRHTDGVRASEPKHTVQEVDGDGDLSFLPGISLRLQLVADHPLEPANSGLYMRTLVVTGRPSANRCRHARPDTSEEGHAVSDWSGRSRSRPRWIAAVRRPHSDDVPPPQ